MQSAHDVAYIKRTRSPCFEESSTYGDADRQREQPHKRENEAVDICSMIRRKRVVILDPGGTFYEQIVKARNSRRYSTLGDSKKSRILW